MKAARPSLASLSAHLARKPSTETTPAEPPNVAPAETEAASRVQLMVRVTPDERKKLRRIALELDTTVQSLIEEAARDVIRRHGGK